MRSGDEPARDWSDVDARLGLPSDAELIRLSDTHSRNHPRGVGRPDISMDGRRIGLFGERAFARIVGLPMDEKSRPGGSRRINFRLADGTTIDVVTRRPWGPTGRTPDLVVPTSTAGSVDVWVLCEYIGPNFEPNFLGWVEEAVAIATAERVIFRGASDRYRENFRIRYGELNPMWQLFARHNPDLPEAQPPTYATATSTVARPIVAAPLQPKLI